MSRRAKPITSKPMVRETVSLYNAKTDLSALVERANAGEEIVITKSGKPKARLVPLEDVRSLRVPGKGAGLWEMNADWDAPLTDEELRDWGMLD